MKKYNISVNLIRVIKNLYDTATNAVLNSSIGDWFRTTVGVRQGCLLSPTHPLQHISGKDSDRHLRRTLSVEGRTVKNPRFADDIDGLAGEEELPT